MDKNTAQFKCEPCDFKCDKMSNFDKHKLTRKHLCRTDLEQKKSEIKFSCKQCNKEYKARNSLWYHEKKCTNEKPVPETTLIHAKYLEIIDKLLTENRELRQKLS
jgi:hypothetical protein